MQARDAVQRRYLKSENSTSKRHELLGEFFLRLYDDNLSNSNDNYESALLWAQVLRRLPIHLLHSGNKSSLEKHLCNLDFCIQKCKSNLLGELLFNFRESIATFNLNNGNNNRRLNDYQSFLQASAHVIRRTPTHLIERILLQQAINSYDNSVARKDALQKVDANEKHFYFEWLNRSITLPGCQAIVSIKNIYFSNSPT